MTNFSLAINPGGMTADVLEQAVGKFLALPLPRHDVCFQGGEPLSAGLDFYGTCVGLVRRYAAPEAHPSYTIETDGALITDGWAQFFAAHRFVVSVNLDGEVAHGDARPPRGRDGIARLKKFNVPFNIRMHVGRANVDQPDAVYRYLRDAIGCEHHHYIPDAELTADQWGGFLCRLYDTWFPADTQTVSVRFFDTILAQMVQGAEATCECSSDCRATVVVEPTGDVYPCALYVTPEWKLGNILQDDFFALLKSPLYEAFGLRKRKWPSKCNACDALRYCRGDCVKNRGTDGDSRLCDGLRAFYAHAMPTLSRLGWQLYQKAHGLKPGRNDPCPCGSGKKLKKCCGKVSGGE